MAKQAHHRREIYCLTSHAFHGWNIFKIFFLIISYMFSLRCITARNLSKWESKSTNRSVNIPLICVNLITVSMIAALWPLRPDNGKIIFLSCKILKFVPASFCECCQFGLTSLTAYKTQVFFLCTIS